MPGISADISSIANKNITTVPVMYAMKVDTLYRTDCLSKNQLKQYANEVNGFVINKRSRKSVIVNPL